METLSKSKKQAIIAKIRQLVLKHHINVAKVDYDVWTKHLDSQAASLADADEERFEAGVIEILAKLRTSHTAFFHNVPDRLFQQHTLNATVHKVAVDGSDYWIFLDVFEGGAADRAGIR